ISKNLDVAYQNSAIIPDSASVSNNSVSVKLKDDDETLSLDQLLFGVADEGQLVLDENTEGNNVAIAVNNKAENGGYLYNKPLITVTGTNGGDVMPIGANLYGSDLTTELNDNGNLWSNEFINETLLEQGFVSTGFDVDFAISNVSEKGGASVNAETGDVT